MALYLGVLFWIHQSGVSDPVKNDLTTFSLVYPWETDTSFCHCIPNWSIAHVIQTMVFVNVLSLNVVVYFGCRVACEMVHKELVFFRVNKPEIFLGMHLLIYFSISRTLESLWWFVGCCMYFFFFLLSSHSWVDLFESWQDLELELKVELDWLHLLTALLKIQNRKSGVSFFTQHLCQEEMIWRL